MVRKILILIIFFMPLNILNAQEKIVIHCKINFYKEHLSDTLNKLNIVFERAVRFAEFDDKIKIQKLKSFESSIAAENILKYMKSLGWRLIDSTNTKNLGYTFYFQKALQKSIIDFIPKVQLKPLS